MGKTVMETKKLDDLFLFVLVFVVGAAIMMVELLGTRVLSPLYGSSLYVWSSLIAVTLISLACGYWVGGSVADRFRTRNVLCLIVFLSALVVSLSTFIAEPVLTMMSSWEIRLGCISSALVLFGLPLFLMGMVAPYAVKLKALEPDHIGRSAGRLYAVSTVGSVLGTLWIGFFLIPAMSISGIILIIALALAVISLVGWLTSGARRQAVAALVVAVAIGVLSLTGNEGPFDEAVVWEEQSLHGRLKVIDKGTERFLMIDGVCQTHLPQDLNEPVACEYVNTFSLVRHYCPAAKDMLVIGLGGGGMLRLFAEDEYRITVVEINERLEDVARDHFKTMGDTKVYVEDGRRFVRNSSGKYDVIIMDVPTIDAFPAHLFSLECMKEMAGALRPGGVLAANMIAYLEGDGLLVPQSALRTVREVFPYIEAYTAHFDANTRTGNVIFFAGRERFPEGPSLVRDMMAARQIEFDEEQGMLLRDDYNPLDVLAADASLRFRQLCRSTFGVGMLIDVK